MKLNNKWHMYHTIWVIILVIAISWEIKTVNPVKYLPKKSDTHSKIAKSIPSPTIIPTSAVPTPTITILKTDSGDLRGWNTFIDTEWGISIMYPPTMHISRNSRDYVIEFMLRSDDQPFSGYSLSFLKQQDKKKILTKVDCHNDCLNGYEKIQINNAAGWKEKYYSSYNYYLANVKLQNAIKVTLSTTPNKPDISDFIKMISSFKFVTPVDKNPELTFSNSGFSFNYPSSWTRDDNQTNVLISPDKKAIMKVMQTTDMPDYIIATTQGVNTTEQISMEGKPATKLTGQTDSRKFIRVIYKPWLYDTYILELSAPDLTASQLSDFDKAVNTFQFIRK